MARPTYLAPPASIPAPDPAGVGDLTARAVALFLAGLSGLAGLPVATEKVGTSYKRPVLVVSVDSASERIPYSGVFQVTVEASLETNPATADSVLEGWDGAIWNALQNTAALPAALAAEQPGLTIHAALNASARPSGFADKQRDIAYTVELIAAKSTGAAA
jgi:hypothetical protein